jgi:hypothetical protein
MNNAEEWAKAVGVVALGVIVGAVVGEMAFKSPMIGAVIGLGGGLFVNYKRECPVCMAHLASMQQAMR